MKKIFLFWLFLLPIGLINAQNCARPTGLTVAERTAQFAKLIWNGTDTLTDQFQLEWRPAAAPLQGWTVQRTYGLARGVAFSLAPCTYYYARVRRLCTNGTSVVSDSIEFKTEGCPNPCAYPRNVQVQVVNTSSIRVTWTPANDGTVFEVAAGSGFLPTTITRVTGNSSTHTRMTSDCGTYSFKVRQVCANGAYSDWSPLRTVPNACQVTSVCAAPRNLELEFLSNNVGILRWDSAQNTFPLNYLVQYWETQNPTTRYAVQSDSIPARIIQNLRPCVNYSFQVSKICGTDTLRSMILARTAPCDTNCMAPITVSATATNNTISGTWTSAMNSQLDYTYVVSIRPLGGTVRQLSYLSRGSGSFRFDSVQSCAVYEIKVERNCNGTQTVSNIATVTTTGCTGGGCSNVTGFQIFQNGSGLTAVWDTSSANNNTQILKYWEADNLTTTQFLTVTGQNSAQIFNLRPCRPYSMQLWRFCGRDTIRTNIVTAQTNCPSGCNTAIVVNATTNNAQSITVNWTSPNAPFAQYVLEWGTATATLNQVPLPNTGGFGSYTLGNLAVCTQYWTRVVRICDSTTRFASSWATTTTTCDSACVVPFVSNISGIAISANTSRIEVLARFQSVSSRGFEIQFQNMDSTAAFRDTMVTDTAFYVTNSRVLNPCNNYLVRVRAVCGTNTYSAWSDWRQMIWRSTLSPQTQFLNDTTVEVTWSSPTYTNFTIIVAGGGRSQTFTTTNRSIVISGLARCTPHVLNLYGRCATGQAMGSSSTTFTTGCSNTPCAPPRAFNFIGGFVGDSILTDTLLRWTVDTSVRATNFSNPLVGAPITVIQQSFGQTNLSISANSLRLIRCQRNYVTAQNVCSNGAVSSLVSLAFDYRPVNQACFGGGGTGGGFVGRQLAAQQLSVLPNPTTSGGIGRVRYELSESATVWLEIVNLQGQSVLKMNPIDQQVGWNEQNIEPNADLPNGIYIVQLRAGKQVLNTAKWVKL